MLTTLVLAGLLAVYVYPGDTDDVLRRIATICPPSARHDAVSKVRQATAALSSARLTVLCTTDCTSITLKKRHLTRDGLCPPPRPSRRGRHCATRGCC